MLHGHLQVGEFEIFFPFVMFTDSSFIQLLHLIRQTGQKKTK